jgi:triacylglycerol lipase
VRTRTILAAGMVAVLLATAAACTTDPPNGAASGKTPVVLIHGWLEGASIWGTMINRLQQAGYKQGDITNLSYNTTGTGQASAPPTAAAKLSQAVDAAIAYARANGNPGATKVDIISHSYGSMVTRYCMAIAQCAGKVAHWVSLAGADGGTTIAAVPQSLGQGSGAAMVIDSPVVQQLRSPQAIEAIRSQGVKIRVFWTNTDGVINPAQNSQWPTPQNPEPGVNVQVADGISHLNIFSNAGVIAQTITFLGT